MGQILIICVFYSICAAGVLVWSTLLGERRELRPQMSRAGIEYVAIPDPSFFDKQFLLITVIAFSTQLFAQDKIPVGTILPVQLNSSLRFHDA